VFRRHRRDGIPQVEIARELGVSPAAVCNLLARAETRLAEFSLRYPDLLDETLRRIYKEGGDAAGRPTDQRKSRT
jgi:predicted transcriptional regulator